MAKTIGKIKALLGLDDKQFQQGIKKSEKQTKGFASSIKKIGLAIGGAFAARKIFDFGKQAVKAANQQLQAEGKLRSAIEANGKAVDSTFEKHVNFAAQLQKVTTVGDETTIQLLQMAESMQSDAPQDAAKGAIALSKAYGMNLQAALKGVTRAQEGDYQMLQRYIPALKTAGTEAEKNAVFQKALADGFDVAKAEAQSGMGAIQQMQNTLGDLMEVIGTAMLPMLTKWADRIKVAAEWVQDNSEQVAKWAKGIGIAAGVLGTARVAVLAFNAAMNANPIGIVITAIAALTSAFITAYQTSDKFRAVVKYVAQTVAYRFEVAFAVIKTGVRTLFDNINTYFNAIGNSAKTLGKAIKAVFTKGESPGEILRDGFKDVQKDIGDLGDRTAKEFKKNFENVRNKPNFEEILNEETAVKKAEESGNKAGSAFSEGMQQGMSGGGAGGGGDSQMGGEMEGRGITPFDTETVEIQLANMDRFKQKNREVAESMQQTGEQSSIVGGIIGNAFQGMQNSISDALKNSKNILQGFWQFFKDFIQGLIIKLVAAATAAAALFALLSLTGISVGGLNAASSFKDVFSSISNIGGGVGMANGGVVPAGYPNDTYPAMLSSGETVAPPGKLPDMSGGGGRSEELKARVSGEDLEFVLNKWGRNKKRIT